VESTITNNQINFKKRIFNILHTEEIDDPIEKYFNWFITGLIFLSVISVILETEKSLSDYFYSFFWDFEIFTVTIFAIEYILHLWVCTIDPRYSSPLLGRIKYACTPMALIDLFAILPFFIPASGLDFRFLRAVRLTRLFRLLKLGRYSQSLRTLGRVLKSKREELLVTLFAGVILLVIASSILYYIERDVQPEKFGSILSAMWWGVCTLTTIGYGDVYPITALGKFIGSIISVMGIGLFVLPAGILASGFSSELQNKAKKPKVCPHCGKEVNFDPNQS
jgi:voltage-gated potassium channel